MKIGVCVKRVPDTETRVKVGDDGKHIDETGVQWVVNPYDEIAVDKGSAGRGRGRGSLARAGRDDRAGNEKGARHGRGPRSLHKGNAALPRPLLHRQRACESH